MTPMGQRQSGVSLIEALIALLVLALGVMGMALAQTRILLESRTTNARAMAVQLAADLSDRMQVNRHLRAAAPQQIPNPYVIDWHQQAPGADCVNAPCSAEELARFDLVQWKAALAHLLPGGDAQVFQAPDDPTQFGILIGWTPVPERSTQAGTSSGKQIVPPSTAQGPGPVPCRADLVCHLVYVRP